MQTARRASLRDGDLTDPDPTRRGLDGPEANGPGTNRSGRRPSRHRAPVTRRLGLFTSVAVVAYLLDQVSKAVVVATMDHGSTVSVLGGVLKLTLTRNPGAAFSLGTGYTVLLSCVALGVVAMVLRLSARLGSRLWAVALGLLLAGALGNLTDRLFREPGFMRGHVVDFLELPHWPVFNLADSSICVAAALIVVQSLRGVRLDGRRGRS